MSLLHATWLPGRSTSSGPEKPALLIWADTWRISKSVKTRDTPSWNPFTLKTNELKEWLLEKKLSPKSIRETSASLTLPSKELNTQGRNNSKITENFAWEGLPLIAGEIIPDDCQWWPWRVDGLAIPTNEIGDWLAKLPLSGKHPDLGDELKWWCHLERWRLSLIARGRWLPQVEIWNNENLSTKARWVPLFNKEEDRQKLEIFAAQLPQVTTCAEPWHKIEKCNEDTKYSSNLLKHTKYNPIASKRPLNNRFKVAGFVEELIDAQLRESFTPNSQGLDPMLKEWQKALGNSTDNISLPEQDLKRLRIASQHWKNSISAQFTTARTCLELLTPDINENLWELNFFLQAQADPSLKIHASRVWESDIKNLTLGEITIENPGEILLEGLGRSISIFPPIERGLDSANPTSMMLTAEEAFIFIRTAASNLRDYGVGVELPNTLSGGLASRLGIEIIAELENSSKGATLGEILNWEWGLMIGGVKLSISELERLANKKSPLLKHKNTWIELRKNDLKNAKKFIEKPTSLSLDDAIRLTAAEGETLEHLPVHQFRPGPRLQNVLEKYHQKTTPDAIPAPEGFIGQLRPYQEKGVGWLAFLYRFDQGSCLADDMGLGKTIQLLAFLQYLKKENELKRPILLIAPTSILTNWRREAKAFTPELNIFEHYGSNRPSDIKNLEKAIQISNLVITSYGIIQRDLSMLSSFKWQGIIIDEAQAIKNPSSKQSLAIRQIAKKIKTNGFKIALTGTPIENKVNEIWALMDFLNPKVLGEQNFFNQRYRLPIERYGDISSLRDLKARVQPFILRRLKTDKTIISDLPDKVELNEWVNLSQEQENLYREVVDKTIKEIASAPLGSKHGKILGLLTKLKQICNHPALALKENNINEKFILRSGKLQRLDQILEELIVGDDKAILFTQFSEWGLLLQKYLQKRFSCEVPFLYGATTKNSRQEMVDQFQQDPRGPKLFLLSLKAGGLGLNLTKANHVFHLDRWWNPAVENQATDRAYRIGQENRVMVHKFITIGSVEEKIHSMILSKSKLANEIIGSGEDWLGKLDIKDIKRLVSLDKS
tara:strand:+ start:10726 stop:13908 length:3183 start_codon:yes stop_codon:yes gene_type:complete